MDITNIYHPLTRAWIKEGDARDPSLTHLRTIAIQTGLPQPTDEVLLNIVQPECEAYWRDLLPLEECPFTRLRRSQHAMTWFLAKI